MTPAQVYAAARRAATARDQADRRKRRKRVPLGFSFADALTESGRGATGSRGGLPLAPRRPLRGPAAGPRRFPLLDGPTPRGIFPSPRTPPPSPPMPRSGGTIAPKDAADSKYPTPTSRNAGPTPRPPNAWTIDVAQQSTRAAAAASTPILTPFSSATALTASSAASHFDSPG